MRLKDQVALVTGTASGIGKAVMERFLQEGAKVVANDINPEGEKACEQLKQQGCEVEFYLMDVSKIDQLPDLVDFTVRKYGKLDILVNNVGMEFPRSVLNMTLEDWRSVQSVNLESVFFLSQAAVKIMKEQRYGRIVNLSSIQGSRGAENSSHYNASKGGLNQLTRCLAIELADDNIMVNAVAPGVIHTGMNFSAGYDETETEKFKDVYIKYGKIPLKRVGKASEVASTVLFLSSDDCQYMTGQVLVVDGGLSVVW